MLKSPLVHLINNLATHLVLGLSFSFSDVGGDDPLGLLSQPGVRIELKGNTTHNCSTVQRHTRLRDSLNLVTLTN